MFCTKCGHEHPGKADYCTQCGTRFTSKELTGEAPTAAMPMTKKEYFADHCSASAEQKRKAIKILSLFSLAIQGILAVLLVVSVGALVYAIEQNPLFEGSGSDVFGMLLVVVLFFTGGAFLFTILGIKKSSTGFFVAATIFSFVSAAYGSSNFESLALRQLIAFGTVAIYIAITVLNYQNNKEYKKYISQQKGENVL